MKGLAATGTAAAFSAKITPRHSEFLVALMRSQKSGKQS
jgi:hypothetical protein